ncbi:MAG: hypothetical protein R2861_16280 [Desulfobacterales bacterium]
MAFSSETVAHAVMTTLAPGEGITTIELKTTFIPASTGRLTVQKPTSLLKRGAALLSQTVLCI